MATRPRGRCAAARRCANLPGVWRMITRTYVRPVIALVALFAADRSADAGAIRAGFNSSSLAANDDGSTDLEAIGFTVNFFGISFTDLYVNNNGNITFDFPLSTYTPFDLNSTGQQIIAPFFSDVDTRSAGDIVTYGSGVVDGHAAFGVNWVNVDYYFSDAGHTNRNSFQLMLIDR